MAEDLTTATTMAITVIIILMLTEIEIMTLGKMVLMFTITVRTTIMDRQLLTETIDRSNTIPEIIPC